MIGFIGASLQLHLVTISMALSLIYTLSSSPLHTLGFSVSTSRILATDHHTETITSNHYEVFWSFLLQSPWTASSPILSLQSPWFLTLYSSVLICTQLWTELRWLLYPLGMDQAQKTHFHYCCMCFCCGSHVITIWPVHWPTGCCLAWTT
jgi:hypothetical protein